MTTPAVNINTTEIQQAKRYTVPWKHGAVAGTETGSVIGNYANEWFTKVRPASTSVTRESDGWRDCKAWEHRGRDFERHDGEVMYTLVYSSTNGTRYRHNGEGSYWNGNVTPPVVPSLPFGLISEAEQKALLKLNYHDFNLGTFLAEARQTIMMVGKHARRISFDVEQWRRLNPKLWPVVKAYQRGNLKCHLWSKIPSSWLELQYGWTPLMSDIWAASVWLSRHRQDKPLFHVKSKTTDTDVGSILFTPPGSTASRAVQNYDIKHEVWVNLWFKLRNPSIAELASLGLLNPAAIVWEKTIYSFVVDWFVPVGNWLESLTADLGFDFQSGSCSQMSRVKAGGMKEVYWQLGVSPKLTFLEKGTPQFKGEAFKFKRTCYDSSPVPGIYFKNPLSTLHALNAIALLVQAFR